MGRVQAAAIGFCWLLIGLLDLDGWLCLGTGIDLFLAITGNHQLIGRAHIYIFVYIPGHIYIHIYIYINVLPFGIFFTYAVPYMYLQTP